MHKNEKLHIHCWPSRSCTGNANEDNGMLPMQSAESQRNRKNGKGRNQAPAERNVVFASSLVLC